MDELDDLLMEMKPSGSKGSAPSAPKSKWAPVNATKNTGTTGGSASTNDDLGDLDLSSGFGFGGPAAKYGDGEKYTYEKRTGGSQHEDALAALLGGRNQVVAYSDQKVERNLNPTKDAVQATKKALMQSNTQGSATKTQERLAGINVDVSQKKEAFKQKESAPDTSQSKARVEGISGNVGAKKGTFTSTQKTETKPIANGTKQHLYELINKDQEKKYVSAIFDPEFIDICMKNGNTSRAVVLEALYQLFMEHQPTNQPNLVLAKIKR